MKSSVGAPFAAMILATGLVAVPVLAQDQSKVTLADVERAVAVLDTAAQGEIDANAVPGMAIAVVFQDRVVFAKGYGVRDAGTGDPVDADTAFQIASVSKSVGSTVIARLVGEGVVSWDSKISDLDPDFALMEPWVTREVTIRDFYSHRSGLPEHAGDLLEDLGYGREEVLHRLRFQHPDTSFRSGYAYTNFGMTEAAVAAARAAGLEWEDLSAERLYEPLGMTATSSRYDEFMARANKALGHVLVDGNWVHQVQRQPDAQTPAGGVSSSVNDLAKWMRLQMAEGMLDGQQLVAKDALTETHLPMIMTGVSSLSGLPQFYGLGWNVNYGSDGRHRISHSGAFAMGAGTTVSISLDDDLGIVVLTNGSPSGIAEGLAANFIDDALYGAPTKEWLSLFKGVFVQMMAAGFTSEYDHPPDGQSPALENAAYLGAYTNDFFGEIEIVEKDGGLAMVAGPSGTTFAMTHYDRDVFTFVTEGENATGVQGILFNMGGDGKAIGVHVEAFDVHGEGRFRRK